MTETGRLVPAHGTELYTEVRGSGPGILLIGGATADAGAFEALAVRLEGDFRVAAYDRRGYSRSLKPEGWAATSTAEQADDAAAVIEAIGLAPTTVLGSSAGANIALELVLRRPELVRAAILHEPFVLTMLGEEAERVANDFKSSMEAAFASGGPEHAMETLIRSGIGEEDYERLDPQLRERMLSGAETLFGVDMAALPLYAPDEAELRAVAVPLAVVFQRGTIFPFIEAIAARLVELTGAELVELPGSHAPFLVKPSDALVETIARLARAPSVTAH